MTLDGRKFVRRIALLLVGGILIEANSRGELNMPPASPAQEGMVKLTDSNVQYFSQGQGKPIVLLPFGGLTVGYMADLSQDLADAGYRVIRINFRGSGKSTGSGEGITLHWLRTSWA